ncbi:MAG: LPXTG cell wall anchor domain-containing protein [Nanoarchaeota archaeon]|nr:LPXTG cell wall anchor domain-containing protein [Nanoarchaeota archaeon]
MAVLLIAAGAIGIGAVIYLFLRRRKKHWQQGYIMIGNFKPRETKPKEDYPIYQPPSQEEKSEDEIIMPPGMFD